MTATLHRRTINRLAAIAFVLSAFACERDYTTVQGRQIRTALADLAAAEDIYYATNLRYSADQSLIVALTLPRGITLTIENADEHGWRASASHEHGVETCYQSGRNDGSAALAVVDGPNCQPLTVGDTLRDVRTGKLLGNAPAKDTTVSKPKIPVAVTSAAKVSPVPRPAELPSVLLPVIEPAEDFGYPTQTVDRLAMRRLLLTKSYDALDYVLAAYADSVLRDYRVEYRLFDAYAAFGIAVPSIEPFLTEWVKKHPNSAAAHIARASFFRASGWNARGYKYSRETKREQFVRMGNFFRLALADLNAARRLDPKSVAVYRQLIDVAGVNGNLDSSRKFLAEGLKLQPNSFVLRMAHMHNLEPRWGGSYQEMAEFAEQAAPYAKRNPRITALKGYVDWDKGRIAERAGRNGDAIEAYQRALQYGNLWEFRYQRASFNSRSEQNEAALEDLNAVLAQIPQNADALNTRSHINYELGRAASGDASANYYAQAFRDIALAAAIDPTDDDILERLAFMQANIPEYAPQMPQ